MMSLEDAIQVALDLEYRSREDIENAIKTFESIKHSEYRLALELKLVCLDLGLDDEECKEYTRKEIEGS
jgi:hypothetical protein